MTSQNSAGTSARNASSKQPKATLSGQILTTEETIPSAPSTETSETTVSLKAFLVYETRESTSSETTAVPTSSSSRFVLSRDFLIMLKVIADKGYLSRTAARKHKPLLERMRYWGLIDFASEGHERLVEAKYHKHVQVKGDVWYCLPAGLVFARVR